MLIYKPDDDDKAFETNYFIFFSWDVYFPLNIMNNKNLVEITWIKLIKCQHRFSLYSRHV